MQYFIQYNTKWNGPVSIFGTLTITTFNTYIKQGMHVYIVLTFFETK